MDTLPGPSRPRRSSDPLLSPRERATKRSVSPERPIFEGNEYLPPPQYTEEPGPDLRHALNGGGTREPLLNGRDDASPRKRSGNGVELEIGVEERRLASIEQRKAIWWRSTFVNALFIASW